MDDYADRKASIEAQKSWEQWHDNVKVIQESNLLETETKQDGDTMNKCYFCGKECGETILTVSDKTSLPSELFRECMCAECSEAVHSALILLRAITKGRCEK